MENIAEIHDKIFLFLFEEAKKDTSFKFTLRRSDRNNRLSKGYWFHGNDHGYIALSFWAGLDWKNKTPNIIFVININDGSTYLEISVGDSETKREFARKFLLIPELMLQPRYGKYYKSFVGNDYMDSLKRFINHEKKIIDNIIEEQRNFFNDDINLEKNNRINFIDRRRFDYWLTKILKYRDDKVSNKIEEYPCYLKEFRIKNYAGISDLSISGLPDKAQWIFLTGENGSGKTSILRALTLALCPNVNEHLELGEIGDFEVNIEMYKGNGLIKIESKAAQLPNFKGYLTKGFAAYGPSRLTIDDPRTKEKYTLEQLKKKSKPAYSIFHSDGILHDFSKKMGHWIRQSNDIRIEEKITIIQETLIECIDQISDIFIVTPNEMPNSNTDYYAVFVETDVNGKKSPYVKHFQLSSGIRSLIAMVGDMMIRLFEVQPETYDVSELKGIVLIDEIDIHFHPKQQRNLIELLSETFPKLQFVATTHSPIPLLGAPEGSVFLNVKRLAEKGITVERLVDLEREIKNLLPNAIYSSDLFDFENLIPKSNENEEEIITEDNYSKIKLEEKIKEQIGFIKNNDIDFLKEMGIGNEEGK